MSVDRWHVAVVLLILLAIGSVGCAGRTPHPAPDAVEALLPAGELATRSAVIMVLTAAGYRIEVNEAERLETGYRRETGGPWNGFLVSRFGTIRSRAVVTLSAELDATRVRIEVSTEGKDGLFASWRPYETPLPRQAETHLRQIRNALDLL